MSEIMYKNHKIEIKTDDDPQNPRDDDNICVIHVAHGKYSFGDVNYNTLEDIEQAQKEAIQKRSIVVPLYMEDHGGITISLTKFTCPWDSGQVGFVEVKRDRMLSEFSRKIFTKQLKAKALEIAQNEVQYLDSYLRGERYGYTIDDDGDSCWGYDSEEYAITEAKMEIEYMEKLKLSVEKQTQNC